MRVEKIEKRHTIYPLQENFLGKQKSVISQISTFL